MTESIVKKQNNIRILIIHAHSNNRGDEAAVKAMVGEILNKYPDANITISMNGATPYPNMPERVKQIPRFPVLQSKFAQIEFFIALFTNGKISFSKHAREFLECVRNSDLVIHAPGGPSIGDTYFKAEKVYLWRLDLIRKMGKKYMFYAPSMGPFKNHKRDDMRRRVLSGADKVLLRDPISVKYLSEYMPELNVEQALDSALQFDIDGKAEQMVLDNYPELKSFIEEHEKCIGITITDLKWHPVHKHEEIIDRIPEAFNSFIDEKISQGYSIVFIPQLYGTSNDTKLMSEYMRENNTFMVDVSVPERDSLFQQYLIGKLYAVVGMRYHSNIFSAKMGTPFISVSYEQKMSGFMQSIGIQEYCIDLYDISANALCDKFKTLENTYEQYREKLINSHYMMHEKAFKSTQAVIDILEKDA